jgi:hypothetical protein
MLRILILALSIALAPDGAQAQSCPQGEIRTATGAMDAARAELRALPLGDGMVTDESPQAQAAIAAMKARIGDFVTAALRCAPETIAAKTVQDDLSRLDQMRAPPDPRNFGAALSFDIRRTPQGLIAVTANFNIECGSDTVLMIFAWRDGAWREVLRSQAAPYKTVAGAFDSFDYTISPPDAAGHWFVVTTTVAPWCSSNWSDISYAVLRPSADAIEPRKIFGAKDWMFREDEDSRLAVGVDDFDLRFQSESVDNAVFTRQIVRHFSVVGDRVRRVAPLADRPRDFAEEWIAAPWSDAKHWTAPGADLEGLHTRLARKKTGLEYMSIRKCGTRTQIEFQPYDSDTVRYFLLVRGNRDFVMQSAGRVADPRCTGKNLYDPDHPN